MVKPKDSRGAYEWMLELSAEGWAWEFLRRNPFYRRDYVAFSQADQGVAAGEALRWGLLQFSDPDIDARMAADFGALPITNRSSARDRRGRAQRPGRREM